MKKNNTMEKKIQKYELGKVERTLTELMEKTLKMENELMALRN